MTLEDLYTIVEQRKAAKPQSSYTASLFSDGVDKIAQKVGEEAVEVVIAAKNNSTQLLIGEVSDLYYHLIVLMVDRGLSFEDIYTELERRHAEKNHQ